MREKPTLLLLHGGPGFDHSIYKPVYSSLADCAQVIYLDNRGNGRSDAGPRDAWTLAQWALRVTWYCASNRPESLLRRQSRDGLCDGAPNAPAKLISALKRRVARIKSDVSLCSRNWEVRSSERWRGVGCSRDTVTRHPSTPGCALHLHASPPNGHQEIDAPKQVALNSRDAKSHHALLIPTSSMASTNSFSITSSWRSSKMRAM
jgi:hypothetical protein